MEAVIALVSLAVWVGVWVLVVKKRGTRGKFVSNVLGAALGFVACIVVVVIFAPEPSPEQVQARAEAALVKAEQARIKAEEEAKTKAEAEKHKDRSVMAAIICSNYVKSSLKSPKSADFPFGYADGGTRRLADQTYMIRSYVDAQNAFGAEIRNWYSCTIQYTSGEDASSNSWDLKGLAFDQ